MEEEEYERRREQRARSINNRKEQDRELKHFRYQQTREFYQVRKMIDDPITFVRNKIEETVDKEIRRKGITIEQLELGMSEVIMIIKLKRLKERGRIIIQIGRAHV